MSEHVPEKNKLRDTLSSMTTSSRRPRSAKREAELISAHLAPNHSQTISSFTRCTFETWTVSENFVLSYSSFRHRCADLTSSTFDITLRVGRNPLWLSDLCQSHSLAESTTSPTLVAIPPTPSMSCITATRTLILLTERAWSHHRRSYTYLTHHPVSSASFLILAIPTNRSRCSMKRIFITYPERAWLGAEDIYQWSHTKPRPWTSTMQDHCPFLSPSAVVPCSVSVQLRHLCFRAYHTFAELPFERMPNIPSGYMPVAMGTESHVSVTAAKCVLPNIPSRDATFAVTREDKAKVRIRVLPNIWSNRLYSMQLLPSKSQEIRWYI